MKFLGVFFALSIGWMNLAEATQAGFELQYVKPIRIQIFSTSKGVTREEYFQCTPQTCCFSERFYCFMTEGECICDLHICEEWPDSFDEKRYWMKISGTHAERVCGRAHALHDLTMLGLCDPDKDPPCGESNRPATGRMTPMHGHSLPHDVRHY